MLLQGAWYVVSNKQWHPITRMWTFEDKEGRQMLGIKFVTASGQSPGSTSGISIHAKDQSVSITGDWPIGFDDEDAIWFYDKQLDDTTRRGLEAEVAALKKLKGLKENKLSSTVVLDTPFPVKETRMPQYIKSVSIGKSGLRWIRFFLESTVEPVYNTKVLEDEVF